MSISRAKGLRNILKILTTPSVPDSNLTLHAPSAFALYSHSHEYFKQEKETWSEMT